MTIASIARKSIISAVTVAIVATAAVSGAEAKDRHNGRDVAIAAGVIGIAAVLLGAARSNAYQQDVRRGGHDYGRRDGGYRECFDKPVRRWNAYEGRKVVVGYKAVCR